MNSQNNPDQQMMPANQTQQDEEQVDEFGEYSSLKYAKLPNHDETGKYIDPEDSNSSGLQKEDNPAVAARRLFRKRRRQYKKFIAQNAKFWKLFNVALAVVSLGFCIGTGFVVTGSDTSAGGAATGAVTPVAGATTPANVLVQAGCGMMTASLYGTMLMNIINFCAAVINLAGKERTICNSNILAVFGITEMGLLIFMQVAFFDAQSKTCLTTSTGEYFWLYSQIVVMYGGLGFILCYVFRKECQDPFLEADSWRRQNEKVDKYNETEDKKKAQAAQQNQDQQNQQNIDQQNNQQFDQQQNNQYDQKQNNQYDQNQNNQYDQQQNQQYDQQQQNYN